MSQRVADTWPFSFAKNRGLDQRALSDAPIHSMASRHMREESPAPCRRRPSATARLVAASKTVPSRLADELIARPEGAESFRSSPRSKKPLRISRARDHAAHRGVAALARELDWRQTYTPADFGERFLQHYGCSEWVGERGAFVSDRIACGVLLLGAKTEYPAHSHEAEELYLPLAAAHGGARANSDWRLRPPGSSSTIPPGHPRYAHADEPLLAAYVWRARRPSAKSRID